MENNKKDVLLREMLIVLIDKALEVKNEKLKVLDVDTEMKKVKLTDGEKTFWRRLEEIL